MLKNVYRKFHLGVMTIGEPGYLSKLYRLAIGTSGAVSIDYLVGLPVDQVIAIDTVANRVAEEMRSGQ